MTLVSLALAALLSLAFGAPPRPFDVVGGGPYVVAPYDVVGGGPYVVSSRDVVRGGPS
jgi:hypothetical protein